MVWNVAIRGIAAIILILVWVKPAIAQQGSAICHFINGPRAGHTIDFTGRPLVTLGPIGTPCQDGLGSYGVLVDSVLPTPTVTTICLFSVGPRAGQSFDFAGMPGVQPVPVGANCQDGIGSFGTAIAPGGAPLQPPLPPQLTYRCQLTTGMRAGSVFDARAFPGIQPIPVGMPCQDGMGSSGTAIP